MADDKEKEVKKAEESTEQTRQPGDLEERDLENVAGGAVAYGSYGICKKK